MNSLRKRKPWTFCSLELGGASQIKVFRFRFLLSRYLLFTRCLLHLVSGSQKQLPLKLYKYVFPVKKKKKKKPFIIWLLNPFLLNLFLPTHETSGLQPHWTCIQIQLSLKCHSFYLECLASNNQKAFRAPAGQVPSLCFHKAPCISFLTVLTTEYSL